MFFDFIKAADLLSVKMAPAPRVFCGRCGKHIFFLKGKSRPYQLISLAGTQYRGSTCPECMGGYMIFNDNTWKIKTDGGLM